MQKYRGDFEELREMVARLKHPGEWLGDNKKRVYRADSGAVLNWWPSTGTLQLQGPAEACSALETALSGALRDDGVTGVGRTGLAVSGRERALDTAPRSDSSASDGMETSNVETVFVVHGHDEAAREQLELVLHRLDLQPFVLANTSGGGLTIIEALEKEMDSSTTGNRFGIVLLTPDDMGYKATEGRSDPEPRARQNVVMEMGMLIAAFGRPRVAILKKGHVEVPSDASGIIYISFNNHVKETVAKLCERLAEAGFKISSSAITKASR